MCIFRFRPLFLSHHSSPPISLFRVEGMLTERILPQGLFTLPVHHSAALLIKPGTVIQINKITVPKEIREPDGPEKDWYHVSRLLLHRLRDGGGVDGTIVIAKLIPHTVENTHCEVRLLPSETYALQITGGGWGLHLVGRVREQSSAPTTMRPCVIRNSASEVDPTSGRRLHLKKWVVIGDDLPEDDDRVSKKPRLE
ncbi:hypothetical protein FA13DRAFT_1711821 [Coprinellus micaceus]|uniref:Uncharacterized protein n=1 Tax=Coprinellus micaceus TaxID=71717 RepID=A0A4Y7T2Z6_COPMI|nr:hypothetical protein FA13DRAFT_1711821 [Coprinellus micaceus]